MKKILNSHVGLLVRRILTVYVVLGLCRVVFYLCNRQLVGAIGGDEAWDLMCGALKFDTVSVIYANCLFIFLSLVPFRFRDAKIYRKILFWVYVVTNAVLVVATNLADCVYFRYTQKRFTADEIFFADNSNSAQLMLKFMGENWGLLLILVALTGMLVLGYGPRASLREARRECRWWAYYPVNLAVLVVAMLVSVAGIRGGITRMTRPITLSNATLYASTSEKANLILSNPFCIIRTAGNGSGVSYERYFEHPEEHFTPVHIPTGGEAQDKNVVIFIVESASAENVPYMPFLDSLMRHGLTFERMYANGTRSIQAMPAVLGSIPSFKTPFVLMPQSLGKSRQLPQMLRDRGYETLFFCGSERGSMGFGAYARSAGVEKLVSREEYEAVHGEDDFDGFWGIWDEPFVGFMGETLSQTKQPFFATLFTLSSHHPFVVPEEYEWLPDGETKIHKSAAYTDIAFRNFYHRFKDESWFGNTIFVFVADHVSSEKMNDQTRTFPGNYHIVGFVHTPDGSVKPQRVTEIVQQIDLMPTLLGVLGDEEPYFAFGRDVFNEPDRAPWAVMYDSEFRVVRDGEQIPFDQDTRLKALIQQYYSHIEAKNYTVDPL